MGTNLLELRASLDGVRAHNLVLSQHKQGLGMHLLITAASGSHSLLVNLAHCFKFYLYISKCSEWKDHKIMVTVHRI